MMAKTSPATATPSAKVKDAIFEIFELQQCTAESQVVSTLFEKAVT
jgi:hypothetical protein